MAEATVVSSLSQSVDHMQQSHEAYRAQQETARKEQQHEHAIAQQHLAQDCKELRLTQESIRKKQVQR